MTVPRVPAGRGRQGQPRSRSGLPTFWGSSGGCSRLSSGRVGHQVSESQLQRPSTPLCSFTSLARDCMVSPYVAPLESGLPRAQLCPSKWSSWVWSAHCLLDQRPSIQPPPGPLAWEVRYLVSSAEPSNLGGCYVRKEEHKGIKHPIQQVQKDQLSWWGST